MKPPPAICPVCDEAVLPKAKACPHCGADERSGWRENALIYDGLNLPDEAWEEEDASAHRNTHAPGEIPFIWRLAGALALAGFLWWLVRGLF